MTCKNWKSECKERTISKCKNSKVTAWCSKTARRASFCVHTSSETAQAKPYAKVSAWVLYVAITTTGKDRMDMLRGHEMWKMLEGEHVNESGVEYVVGVQNIFSGQLFKTIAKGNPSQ